MSTFIAYANTDQTYPINVVPSVFFGNRKRNIWVNERTKQRYDCQRLAYFLLHELCKIAKIDTALLEQVYRTKNGRPQFPMDHIDFNISHSDKWVAVILSVGIAEKSAVGIDIEFVKKSRNYTALLQHFASTEEQHWFAQQQNQQQAFYRIWCSREAILKSQGIGLVKLSEVVHLVEQRVLRSMHCPTGKLIFSTEFPFYLAIFSTADLSLNLCCFHWINQKLQPVELKKGICYRVNPLTKTQSKCGKNDSKF